MGSDPRDVLRVIALSRITHKKMMQLVWATAYGHDCHSAAAGAFVHWGITLPMIIGALAMNLSTVMVAVNAQFYVISDFNVELRSLVRIRSGR